MMSLATFLRTVITISCGTSSISMICTEKRETMQLIFDMYRVLSQKFKEYHRIYHNFGYEMKIFDKISKLTVI